METSFTLLLAALAVAGGTAVAGGMPDPDAANGVAYPGRPPGPWVLTCGDSTIQACNNALAISWARTRGTLGSRTIRDVQTGREIHSRGETLVVMLTSGMRYAASTLTPTGPAVVTPLAIDASSARLAARMPGKQVELPLSSSDGRLRLVWRAVFHDGGNWACEEIDLRAPQSPLEIREITWLDETIPSAQAGGKVEGTPVVAGNLFLGVDDPMAANTVGEGGRVVCQETRYTTLAKDESLKQSFVVGVAPTGRLRRGFLFYLERERAHPYRPFLHYNSWYDISWAPFALNEANCLEAIRLFGDRFIKAHGVVMDGIVFDDGWDDPRTLWKFHDGFPRGFAPLAALCKEYDTRLGVWLSPFGGYGASKDQRLKFGREQGYETNATGFSLAGPKYRAAFQRACAAMIRKYGVVHFKFDGIANGMYASGGAGYLRDTESMRRLMIELRREDTNLYINLTTGSWPSPFWLKYADSLWRQGGDMGLAGAGPTQQQWLTYRDQETYRNIVLKSPLYPLNALMTQGVAYSRQGPAGEASFNASGFKDDVHAFFGSGTSLQELYIQPGKLTSEDWRVLAEAAKWSRANADVLVDTHWIGGDPSKGEVYGYASWSPRKGAVMLRNPDNRPHTFALDAGTAFELPPAASTRYTLQSPWADDVNRAALVAAAGQPLQITLRPFEVAVFDAIPSR